MSFDRGYISHHMVTDREKMEAVLERPLILMTDLKHQTRRRSTACGRSPRPSGRPLIIADEVAPEVVVTLLGKRRHGKYLVVHAPEYGHWRKALMEDLAILTGGRVIARDLGGGIEDVTREDLGGAERVRIERDAHRDDPRRRRSRGDRRPPGAGPAPVRTAPPNIEQDKLRERVAKLSGGTAVLYAGGVTPVEQKRTIQLIEDSLSAVRAAVEEGVVAGGGMALAQIAPGARHGDRRGRGRRR